MTVLLLAAAATLTLAVTLLVVGARGRRVDDHPVCRRCGFDLTGRPVESTRCAECGADLTHRRAVRVGHRRRRSGMLATGAALLLVAGVPLGLIGWGRARGVDWNRHKPGWWLVVDAKSTGPATRDAALAELFNRVDGGTLADRDLGRLVDHALAVQGDNAKPWLPVWGDVVERARARGKLTDAQWARFVGQVAGPEAVMLRLSSPTRDSEVTVTFLPGTFRVGSRHQGLHARVWLPPPRTWPGPQPDWDEFRSLSTDFGGRGGWGTSSTTVPVAEIAPAGAEPGRHTARLPVRIEVYDVQHSAGDLAPLIAPAHAERVVERTADWHLLLYN